MLYAMHTGFKQFPLSYAGITQIRFKGTKAFRLISARTGAPSGFRYDYISPAA